MKISLAEEDRQRFGCAEWLDEADRLSTREAEQLETAGADPRELNTWKTGNPTVKAIRMAVWLALLRAGHTIPFEECHFDLTRLRLDMESGKAPSATSGSRTRSKSASASRSSISARKR